MLIAPLIVLICIGASSARDPLFREEPKNQVCFSLNLLILPAAI